MIKGGILRGLSDQHINKKLIFVYSNNDHFPAVDLTSW